MINKKVIAVVSSLLVFTVLCYVGSFFILRYSISLHGSFTSDEDCSVETFSLSYNLVRINDKLYYNNNPNNQLSPEGIYEIDSNGSRYIEKLGVTFLSRHYEFKGKLLHMETDNGMDERPLFNHNVFLYDPKTGEEESTVIDCDAEILDYRVYKDVLYLISSNTLYSSTDCENFRPVTSVKDMVSEYSDYKYGFGGNCFYYVNKDNTIKEFNLSNKKTSEYKIPKKLRADTFDFIVCGGSPIYINWTDEAFIYNVKNNFDLLCKTDMSTWCTAGNKLFFNKGDNIVSIDIKTKQEKEIIANTESIRVRDLYVFGDKWLYYEGYDSSLNRVPQSGGDAERILGQ